MRCSGLLFAVLFAGCTTDVSRLPETPSGAAAAAAPTVPDFARDVRPVREQRCVVSARAATQPAS